MIQLFTTVTGSKVRRDFEISWDHTINGTIISDPVLVTVVAVLDSGLPRVASATFSGSTVKDMELVGQVATPGGKAYPNGFIFALASPVSPAENLTGEVKIQFDEVVNLVNGVSAVFTGVDTSNPTVSGGLGRAINTQLPDFAITELFTTTVTGAMVIDLCFSESSNHIDHIPGPEQVKFAEFNFSGPKFSATYRSVPTATGVIMSRSDAGGPHAGTTLTLMALRST